MKTSKFSEEQIIGFLRQAEAGMPFKKFLKVRGFANKDEFAASLKADPFPKSSGLGSPVTTPRN